MFLHQPEEKLGEMGAFHTHKEISQQPKLWNETFEIILKQKEEIANFLEEIYQKHKQVKVIFTGAGTSAFVGDTIQPYLNKVCDKKRYNMQSIATTNIVSNPLNYLDADTPTIMVSFARSGNSPESVASVELGEKIVKDFYKVHITCNKDGHLAKTARENGQNTLLLLMPEESNDQSFAMTSSFTCMMLSALLVFQHEKLDTLEPVVRNISSLGTNILTNAGEILKEIAVLPINNIVYLGSGPMLGLSHEASLKMLELTDGGVFTYFESPLGFRHGPKTILNDQTLVWVYLHREEYTQKYDLDLLKELYQEKARTQLKIAAISDEFSEVIQENSDFYFYNQDKNEAPADDIWSVFPFVVYAQMFAVLKSLQMGFQPDNPVQNGSVNRVVQGVTIYPF